MGERAVGVGAGQQHEHVGPGGEGAPGLDAVDDPAPVDRRRRGHDAGHVGAVVGLGHGDGGQDLGRGQLGQPVLLLLLGAPVDQGPGQDLGPGDERAADAERAPAQLLGGHDHAHVVALAARWRSRRTPRAPTGRTRPARPAPRSPPRGCRRSPGARARRAGAPCPRRSGGRSRARARSPRPGAAAPRWRPGRPGPRGRAGRRGSRRPARPTRPRRPRAPRARPPCRRGRPRRRPRRRRRCAPRRRPARRTRGRPGPWPPRRRRGPRRRRPPGWRRSRRWPRTDGAGLRRRARWARSTASAAPASRGSGGRGHGPRPYWLVPRRLFERLSAAQAAAADDRHEGRQDDRVVLRVNAGERLQVLGHRARHRRRPVPPPRRRPPRARRRARAPGAARRRRDGGRRAWRAASPSMRPAEVMGSCATTQPPGRTARRHHAHHVDRLEHVEQQEAAEGEVDLLGQREVLAGLGQRDHLRVRGRGARHLVAGQRVAVDGVDAPVAADHLGQGHRDVAAAGADVGAPPPRLEAQPLAAPWPAAGGRRRRAARSAHSR